MSACRRAAPASGLEHAEFAARSGYHAAYADWPFWLYLQALPSDQPAQWNEREELQDLYSVYVAKQHDDSKQAELQQLFGLSDKEANSLREVVESGQFKIEEEEKEESFF